MTAGEGINQRREAPDPLWRRLYNEMGAGGYSRVAGTVAFHLRLAALTPEGGSVLDLGAGRNRLHESAAADVLLRIIDLPRHSGRLVGADVDDAVMGNTFVKERLVFDPTKPLPFMDGEFDLVYCDWVLEHIEHPKVFAPEILRITRPGGWFCARTPNRWGVTGVGSHLLSTSFKKRFIDDAPGARTGKDVFPTYYRMNTLAALAKSFPGDKWDDFSYICNSEPPYVRSRVTALAMLVAWRMMPDRFATNIICLKRKK
jgi:SAM-dependent methyltransferase